MTGNQKSICEEGVFSVCLPLHNGKDATFSGLCLPQITSEFPIYDLSNVKNDIHKKSKKIGGQELADRLPKLPVKVGGETDILVLRHKVCEIFPEINF